MLLQFVIVAVFVGIASSSTASPIGQSDGAVLKAAKAAVLSSLRDPDSAKFAPEISRQQRPNVRGEPTDVVCGKVNAKNGFGGYSGKTGFLYFVADGKVWFANGRTLGDVDRQIYARFCG